jgi:two-component system chemotaxis response regulator CheB
MPQLDFEAAAGVRRPQMNYDVVVIGASAGGVDALPQILGAMPGEFGAPIVLVQHIAPRSAFPTLLAHHTHRDVRYAAEAERLRPGTIYVAPAEQHLTLTPDYRCALTRSDKVNYARPSIDVLFRSAAATCRGRVLAVVLTGFGCDGAEGARAVKQAGGTVIAQDAATSREFSMPSAAIRTGCVDYVLPLDCIARAIIALVTVPCITTLFPAKRAA